VSLISRCDSAAIVSKTSEVLPEPETPVKTVSLRLGISMLTFFRLLSRAPTTRIYSCSFTRPSLHFQPRCAGEENLDRFRNCIQSQRRSGVLGCENIRWLFSGGDDDRQEPELLQLAFPQPMLR